MNEHLIKETLKAHERQKWGAWWFGVITGFCLAVMLFSFF